MRRPLCIRSSLIFEAEVARFLPPPRYVATHLKVFNCKLTGSSAWWHLFIYRIAEALKASYVCNLRPFQIDEGLR
jgi:hypothetical protein